MSEHLNNKIVIVGQGYVGLPLALAFSAVCKNVIGFDTNTARIADLQNGIDHTREADEAELKQSGLEFSADPGCLKNADFIIVTVPTPTDKNNRPDFAPLKQACETIAAQLNRKNQPTIIFESTVYPTTTEQVCGTILEEKSGLKRGVDFNLAYSPERINPGDKQRPLSSIVKIVSGQDDQTLDVVARLYETIITAGVHRAPSIAVAEAAKVIENTQRDLNIALMNELALICDRLDISTHDVIDAAATKWNFLRFTPGLVGGHCIGVDPYYLTAKAQELGYHPEVILSGRRINDHMPEFVAQRIIKLLAAAGQPVGAARVGILGATFKEDVPDFRNSKVFDVITELNNYSIVPILHDPFLHAQNHDGSGRFEVAVLDRFKNLNCLILAVPHAQFRVFTSQQLSAMIAENGIFVDIKSIADARKLRGDITNWGL